MISATRATLVLLCTFTLLSAPPLSSSQSKDATDRRKTFGRSLKQDQHQPKTADNGAVGSQDEETIRVETNLVVSDVLVLNDKGNAIVGLGKDQFVVTDNDVPQELELFANGTGKPVPRSIVLIIDYSGSQAPFLKTSIAAAKTLVDKLGPQDRMAVVTDDVKLVSDFTHNKPALKKALDSIASDSANALVGKSLQYSALLSTLREVINVEDLRPIIIMQSDGDEARFFDGPDFDAWTRQFRKIIPKPPGHFSFEELHDALERSRVTLYNVIPGIRFLGLDKQQLRQAAIAWNRRMFDELAKDPTVGPQPDPSDDRVIRSTTETVLIEQGKMVELAALTGGYTEFLQRPEEADDIYGRILKVINNRYILGYYPAARGTDGKRRSVKIEVKGHPEYTVLGRKTYLPRQ